MNNKCPDCNNWPTQWVLHNVNTGTISRKYLCEHCRSDDAIKQQLKIWEKETTMTEQTQPLKEQPFTSTLAKYEELRDQLHKAAQAVVKEVIKFPEEYTELEATQAWNICATLSMQQKQRDQRTALQINSIAERGRFSLDDSVSMRMRKYQQLILEE